MRESLPLFPLGQPLFPGIDLNLQIFEQRYLRLIRACMRNESGFGIVAISNGAEVGEPPTTYDIGLEVKVTDWRQQKNGLLGVTVSGDRRFQIESIQVDESGLSTAQITWLVEADQKEVMPEECLEGLEQLLRDLTLHPSLGWVSLPEQLSPLELSWKLAQVLPVSLESKIDLLGELNTSRRITRILALIEELEQC